MTSNEAPDIPIVEEDDVPDDDAPTVVVPPRTTGVRALAASIPDERLTRTSSLPPVMIPPKPPRPSYRVDITHERGAPRSRPRPPPRRSPVGLLAVIALVLGGAAGAVWAMFLERPARPPRSATARAAGPPPVMSLPAQAGSSAPSEAASASSAQQVPRPPPTGTEAPRPRR
ncbi:MAG: hypothetical protein JST00_19065 [Deltaproteobacteria bacterium]|nr:hypothetical protein [Deltaproteobacteria bacterium]